MKCKHKWIANNQIGCRENPGCISVGAEMHFYEVCARCGAARVVAQDVRTLRRRVVARTPAPRK